MHVRIRLSLTGLRLGGERGGRGAVPNPLAGARSWVQRRVRPEFAALLALAAVLNLWDLSRNGWANGYYAAAVRSMAGSWHNFLYASFDPSGADDGRQAAARALGAGALGAESSASTPGASSCRRR